MFGKNRFYYDDLGVGSSEKVNGLGCIVGVFLEKVSDQHRKSHHCNRKVPIQPLNDGFGSFLQHVTHIAELGRIFRDFLLLL